MLTTKKLPFFRPRRVIAAICGAAICLITMPVSAQNPRSTVSGQVVDATGLVVVGASVTLHRPSAGFERTTLTNSAGRYEFVDVPDGTYSLSGTLAGFSLVARTINVSREAVTVNLLLQPGSFTEEVSVIGARLAG